MLLDKVPAISSTQKKLINANASRYTNLHRGHVEIMKSTINLFKVIRKGNKTNGNIFNRKHKGSQHMRRILLLYLGAHLLFHETLLLFSLLFLCLMESKAECTGSLRLQSLYTRLLLCDIRRVRRQSTEAFK